MFVICCTVYLHIHNYLVVVDVVVVVDVERVVVVVDVDRVVGLNKICQNCQ